MKMLIVPSHANGSLALMKTTSPRESFDLVVNFSDNSILDEHLAWFVQLGSVLHFENEAGKARSLGVTFIERFHFRKLAASAA